MKTKSWNWQQIGLGVSRCPGDSDQELAEYNFNHNPRHFMPQVLAKLDEDEVKQLARELAR